MRNKSMYLFFSLMLMIVPCQHVFAQASGGVIIGPPAKPSKPNNPSKPKTGTLSITSTPSGTAVKLGDKYVGETPLTLDKQKPGTYKVTFSVEGYETITKSVTVTAGKTATCSATLSKKQVQQPVVEPPTATSTATTTGTSTATPVSSSSVQTITVNGVSFKMVQVEGGTFQMGSTSGDNDEQPVHQVTLSSFSIGETEVTQELWQAVMGTNPSYFKGNNLPVETVSWIDCQTFITKLNELTGKTFRLPTEAEWEYAARGGNKSQGYTYSGSNTIDDVAWYWDTRSRKTHAVATKAPNELGIYDMSGNVSEWCQDWYSENYYSESVVNNPQGPSSGSYLVYVTPVSLCPAETVEFAQNKATLSNAAKDKLSQFEKNDTVYLDGYATPEGAKNYNQKLSQSCVDAVKAYLEDRGVKVKGAHARGVEDWETIVYYVNAKRIGHDHILDRIQNDFALFHFSQMVIQKSYGYRVEFAQNKATLSNYAKNKLSQFEKNDTVILAGYASLEGAKVYNQKLAQKCIDVVIAYLEDRGVIVADAIDHVVENTESLDIARGGHFDCDAENCRVTRRFSFHLMETYRGIGLRLAL